MVINIHHQLTNTITGEGVGGAQIHVLTNKCLQHLQIKTIKDNLLSRLKITDVKTTKPA